MNESETSRANIKEQFEILMENERMVEFVMYLEYKNKVKGFFTGVFITLVSIIVGSIMF